MDQQWGPKDVAPALLFDRLAGGQPFEKTEKTPLRGYDRERLYASLHRELTRLLNTRCPVSGDLALSRMPTILEYGLPDLDQGGRQVLRDSDRKRVTKIIQRTIEAYEPRLRNVEVEILKWPEPGTRLEISIEGVVTIGAFMEPLSFALAIGGDAHEHGPALGGNAL